MINFTNLNKKLTEINSNSTKNVSLIYVVVFKQCVTNIIECVNSYDLIKH